MEDGELIPEQDQSFPSGNRTFSIRTLTEGQYYRTHNYKLKTRQHLLSFVEFY